MSKETGTAEGGRSAGERRGLAPLDGGRRRIGDPEGLSGVPGTGRREVQAGGYLALSRYLPSAVSTRITSPSEMN